ncbi:MAG: hypothetical protein COA36_15420 [Desulfotalea sp.]|nr:MAG: hypothetical protein COA36_15420 [Desulfotalea sp.]
MVVGKNISTSGRSDTILIGAFSWTVKNLLLEKKTHSQERTSVRFYPLSIPALPSDPSDAGLVLLIGSE